MERLPRSFSMGSQGTEVTVQELVEKPWSLELRGPDVLTDFDAEIISVARNGWACTPARPWSLVSPTDSPRLTR